MKKNYNRQLSLFSFTLGLMIFAACAHAPPERCQELDWYELGRQDGTRGLTSSSRRHVEVLCKDSDQSLSEAFYNNGFDSGIAQFCTTEKGFELGRIGAKPIDVCPPLQQSEFSRAFERGRRYTQIETEQREIHKRIQNLEIRLKDKSIEIVKRGLLRGEKFELQEKSKFLETELQSMSDAESSVRK